MNPAPHPNASASSTHSERALALRVITRLRQAGHVALLAGGCVRDELLGIAPSDYDVATDAPPARVGELFARTAHVGAHFGVVLVREGPLTVEVATFRSDGVYQDARRPDSVRFSTPGADAARRDFTINALFLDPTGEGAQVAGCEREGAQISEHAGAWGRGLVVDFVGGREDLASRVLRAVGDPDARLAEDHLRALRGVRLSSRLGFALDAVTARAITRHAMDLKGVSAERVGDELRRMLAHPTRVRAAEQLEAMGLVPAVVGMALPGRGAREASLLCTLEADAGFARALLAWGHGLGVALAGGAGVRAEAFIDACRRGMCLSNDEVEEMRRLVQRLEEFATRWEGTGVARRKRIVHSAFACEALSLLRGLDVGRAERIAGDIRALEATASGLRPEALISGDDLLAIGMRGGPKFKVVLDGVYDAQLEDRVRTREEAISEARRLAGL